MRKLAYSIVVTIALASMQADPARAEEVNTTFPNSSLFGSLIELTGGEPSGPALLSHYLEAPERPPVFTIVNNSYRTIRMAVLHENRGYWAYVELAPYDVWRHWNKFSTAELVQAQVWNASKQKWVGKDTQIIGPGAVGEVFKLAKREYRFGIWRYLR